MVNLRFLYSEREFIGESLFRRENISLLIDILDKFIKNSTVLKNTFDEYTYDVMAPPETTPSNIFESVQSADNKKEPTMQVSQYSDAFRG